MANISHLADNVFWNAHPEADLYLRGCVPDKNYSFRVGFDGKLSSVPFKTNDFAVRELFGHIDAQGKKARFDMWVENDGPGKIDRVFFNGDLTSVLKNGADVEILVRYPDLLHWNDAKYSAIPSSSVTKYTVRN